MRNKKIPTAWRSFQTPIYGPMIYAYRSRAKFAKACEIMGAEVDPKDAMDGVTVQIEDESGVEYVVGWFNNKNSVLIHEICHVAMFILIRAGINPHDSNGETMCYLMGELVERFEGTED